MFRLATEHLGVLHLQAKPGALGAPGRNCVTIQAILLGWQGGSYQVIDQTEHVGAVARAHQCLGIRGRGAGVVVPAAGVQQVTAATGANRDTH
ncbi:hypothetical protein D3C73_1400200 [compost metagenome]